uniref:Uncharacterized protein n=1 Tax=viral metagenome TaxID=1070528 RepID=A0A6C0ELT2_9ZZZZ
MSEDLVIDPKTKYYSRSYSTTRGKLYDDILKLYGDPQNCVARVFPSGMATISAVFSSFGKKKILLSDELYCDTPRLLKYQEKDYVDIVDVTDNDTILKLFQNNDYDLFFLESCSNPSGKILDWTLIPKIKEISPCCVICVDNTWLSGASFNPLSYGADIVIESMSKYISGSKCIGGMVVGKNLDEVDMWLRKNGQYVADDHCRIFIQGIKSLKDRIEKTGRTALEVAKHLEKSYTTMYPALLSHPSQKIFADTVSHCPGNIWFYVPRTKSRKRIMDILNKNKEIAFETSYGSFHTRIDPWPKFDLQPVPGVWLRLAIGYEDKSVELIPKLEKLFAEF